MKIISLVTKDMYFYLLMNKDSLLLVYLFLMLKQDWEINMFKNDNEVFGCFFFFFFLTNLCDYNNEHTDV